MPLPDKTGLSFTTGYERDNRGRLVIKFDDKARKEYLTGFRRRKDLRRKHAQEMEDANARREREQERQARRDALKEVIAAQLRARAAFEEEDVGGLDDSSDSDSSDGEGGSKPRAPKKRRTVEYEDEFSKSTFGSEAVTVTTRMGFPDSEDESDGDGSAAAGAGSGAGAGAAAAAGAGSGDDSDSDDDDASSGSDRDGNSGSDRGGDGAGEASSGAESDGDGDNDGEGKDGSGGPSKSSSGRAAIKVMPIPGMTVEDTLEMVREANLKAAKEEQRMALSNRIKRAQKGKKDHKRKGGRKGGGKGKGKGKGKAGKGKGPGKRKGR